MYDRREYLIRKLLNDFIDSVPSASFGEVKALYGHLNGFTTEQLELLANQVTQSE